MIVRFESRGGARWAWAAGAVLLVTAGCIDLREEVVVRPDGRATYALDIALPEMFLGLGAAAGDTSGGSPADRLWGPEAGAGAAKDSVRVRDFLEGDMRHFVSERDLVSLDHLAALSIEDTAQAGMRGKVLDGFEVDRTPDGHVRLRRVLEATKAAAMAPGMGGEGDSAEKAQSEAAAKRMFAGRLYAFRLTAPSIRSTNGTLSADRKTAEWSFPLTAVMADTTIVLEAVLEAKK
jgi:hypothetical protein